MKHIKHAMEGNYHFNELYLLIKDSVCALLRFIDMLPIVHCSLKLSSSWHGFRQAALTAHTIPVLPCDLFNFILPLDHLEH